MSVTDQEAENAIRLLLADIQATLGQDYARFVRAHSDRLRTFLDEPGYYRLRLVEETQQQFHDEFIDTSWPRCPIHQRHPLWLEGDEWRCGDVVIARLGQLNRS